MSNGLTDKKTLSAIMRSSREERQTTHRLRELAVKGSGSPELLTRNETQELCGSVLRLLGRRSSF